MILIKIIKYFYLLSFFIISINSAQGIQKDQWSGEGYTQHSKSQQDDAIALLKSIQLKGNENILDIGSGDGRFSLLLAKSTKGKVVGIDPSDSMLEKANSLQKTSNLYFIKAKAEDFSFPEKFDVIFSTFALHWVKDQSQALENMYQHLKPGGKIFLLLSPSKEGLPFDNALKKTVLKWEHDFQGFKNTQYFFDTETYRKLLINAGFHVNKIIYQFNQKNYQEGESLSNWIKQWLPHYKYLPENKKEAFMQDLMHAYFKEIHAIPNQNIIWGEYMMQVEAVSST